MAMHMDDNKHLTEERLIEIRKMSNKVNTAITDIHVARWILANIRGNHVIGAKPCIKLEHCSLSLEDYKPEVIELIKKVIDDLEKTIRGYGAE